MASNRGRTGANWKTARAITIANNRLCYRCHKPVDRTLSGRHPLGPTAHHEPPMAAVGITNHADHFAIYGLDGLKLMHRRCNEEQSTRPTEESGHAQHHRSPTRAGDDYTSRHW